MTARRGGRLGGTALAAFVTGAIACTGSSAAPDAGASGGRSLCASVTAACWQCTQGDCPTDWSCIKSTCGAYWGCLCACPEDAPPCFAACQVHDTADCQRCMTDVGACEATQCRGPCEDADRGSPVGGLACESSFGAGCADPTIDVAFCFFGQSSTACTSGYYAVGASTFPCASCLPADLEKCGAQAAAACVGQPGK
jgi:hypothetical protein